MKKYFASAALAVITLSACQKDHTCACTASDSADNFSYSSKAKKKDAQDACNTYGTTYASVHAGGKCDLK